MFTNWFGRQAAAAVIAMAALAATISAPGAQQVQWPLFPSLTVQGGLRGDDAVRALGKDFGTVAAWYGWTEGALKTEIGRWEADPTKTETFDGKGQLFLEEGFGRDIPAPERNYPKIGAQADRLHSKPDATRKIVLDFRGAQLTGTSWNGSSTRTVTLRSMFPGGYPAELREWESEYIARIWNSVADDFAPFDVDVTTDEVADEDLRRTGPDDTAYGIRVVIYDGPEGPCRCDGAVYIKSFGDPSKPILLNVDGLAHGDAFHVANAVSHLLGHALGLRDDWEKRQTAPGVVKFVPSEGEEIGGRRTAPIMGNPFNAEVSRFNNGSYPNAAMLEPDVAVMQRNGLPLRTDLAGPSRLLAAYPSRDYNMFGRGGVVGWYGVNGNIEGPWDADVFAVNAGAGYIDAAFQPTMLAADGWSPNLKFEVSVWDNTHQLGMAEVSPYNPQRQELGFYAPVAGTYYIRIRPAGERTGSKEPDYGNRGSFYGFIRARLTNSEPPVAKVEGAVGLKGNSITLKAYGSSDDRGITQYRWDFGDGSPPVTTTVPTVTKVYDRQGIFTTTVQVTDVENFTSAAKARVYVLDHDIPVNVAGQ